MQHTIKKTTKTLACFMALLLSQGFTWQQPVKPTTPTAATTPPPLTQDKKLTPKQEQISALHKKLAQTAKISKANAKPSEAKPIENLPILIANFKTKLQTIKTQTITVSQQRLGETKLVDTYTFINNTNTDAKNSTITATTAKNPKQKLMVSTELTRLMQSFLADSSLLGQMLSIKALPVGVKDQEKNVAQRLQIKPKSEFKKLLGFSNGNVKFDAKGNLLSIELLTHKSGVQIYEFSAMPRANAL